MTSISSRRPVALFLVGCLVGCVAGAIVTVVAIRLRPALVASRVPRVEHDTSAWREVDRGRLAAAHPFLDLARLDEGEIHIPTGTLEVHSSVLLPRGVRVTVEAGATLRLGPGVSILFQGPVDADGGSTPIRFERLDAERPYGVVAVLSDGASRFRSVHVTGGSEAVADGVVLSGALSIHGGKAEIEDCRFADNLGDDGLNLRNTRGRVAGSVFQNNTHDGLDIDGSRVSVLTNRFEGNGKDAIDSGDSVLSISGNVLEGSRRCIALGEGSRAELGPNEFRGCEINLYADGTSLLQPVRTDP